jgi:putative phosphoesterase
MQIGVVSDTHNNLKNIDKIITIFNEKNISLVIHTGDIANAKSLEKFSKLQGKLIGVYGNNDRNEEGIKKIADINHFSFKEPPKVVTLCHKNVAVFHEPDLIDDFLRQNNNTDVVIHGHTHRYRNETKNGVLFFNPGECAGMQVGSNAVGVIDLISLEAKRIFF